MNRYVLMCCLMIAGPLLATDASDISAWEQKTDPKGKSIVTISPVAQKDSQGTTVVLPGKYYISTPIYDPQTGVLVGQTPYFFDRQQLQSQRAELIQKIADIDHLLTEFDSVDASAQAVTP